MNTFLLYNWICVLFCKGSPFPASVIAHCGNIVWWALLFFGASASSCRLAMSSSSYADPAPAAQRILVQQTLFPSGQPLVSTNIFTLFSSKSTFSKLPIRKDLKIWLTARCSSLLFPSGQLALERHGSLMLGAFLNSGQRESQTEFLGMQVPKVPD